MTVKHVEVTSAQGVTVSDIFEAILGVRNKLIHVAGGGHVYFVRHVEAGKGAYSVAEVPPYDQLVAETIQQFEDEYQTEANVEYLNFVLIGTVTPTEEDILAVETDPRFALPS